MTVDLPTPPLPDATAIILLIPGIGFPFITLAFGFAGASTFYNAASHPAA